MDVLRPHAFRLVPRLTDAAIDLEGRKEVASSLRSIYTAPTEEAGLMALAEFEETWGRKYPQVVLS